MQHGEAHGDHSGAAHDGHESHGRAPRSVAETFLIPLAIPVGAAALIATIILSVSQVLLALPANAATAIAMVIALAILLGCAYFATARKVTRQTVLAGVAIPAIVLYAAGIGARIYRVNNPEEAKGGETQAAGAVGAPKDEVTTDNKFSVTAYTLEAGAETTINVLNKGTNTHNVHILDVQGADGNDIKTDLLPGGGSAKLTFTIAREGEYKFRCDVHPTEMTGSISVKPASGGGGAAAGAAGAPAGGIQQVTTDNKFSQTSITVQSGAATTLTVQNKGNAIHNWSVPDVKSADGADIKTPLTEAGKSSSITFTIDKPGSYPFRCDVHPTDMKGTLVVK